MFQRKGHGNKVTINLMITTDTGVLFPSYTVQVPCSMGVDYNEYIFLLNINSLEL